MDFRKENFAKNLLKIEFKNQVTIFRILIFALAISVAPSCTKKTDFKFPVGQIQTEYGEILFLLFDETPNHRASFIRLSKVHFWDSLTFNRVVPDFVIQGGCPDTEEGFSGSPYLLDPEFNDTIRHIYGAVGAGRDDNPQMQSAGCQFYIVQNKNGLHRLDGKYTVFGQVFKGMEVVEKIAHLLTDSLDQPIQPVKVNVKTIWLTKEESKKKGYKLD